jgi:hypothetical protein
MNATELINNAWMRAEGEVFADGVGSDSWDYMFGLANYYIPIWAKQYGVKWVSLYDPIYPVGTVSATDTYDLDPSEVDTLSDETGDYVRVLHTGTVVPGQLPNYTNYKVVPAKQLQRTYYEHACAKIGNTLKFSRPFISTDPEFGGTIQAPIYAPVSLLADKDSIVPVDQPSWLVCMIAYDVALHDILRKDIAGSILADANDIFKSMKSDNNEAQENRVNEVDMSFIGNYSLNALSGTANPLDTNYTGI